MRSHNLRIAHNLQVPEIKVHITVFGSKWNERGGYDELVNVDKIGEH
jgi:hypothetical protein